MNITLDPVSGLPVSISFYSISVFFFQTSWGRLRSHETVRCPFSGCEYKTNKLTNFTSHSNRKHKRHTIKDIRNSVTVTENLYTDTTNFDDNHDDAEQASQSVQEAAEIGCESMDIDTLTHKLAPLFLKMQTVLHVSKSAIHSIIEEMHDILYISKSLAVENI